KSRERRGRSRAVQPDDVWEHVRLGTAQIFGKVDLGPAQAGDVDPADVMRVDEHVQRVLVLAQSLTLFDHALQVSDEGWPGFSAAFEEAHALPNHVPRFRHHLLAQRDHTVAAGIELDLLAGVRETAVE